MQFIDLAAQQAHIKDKLDAAIQGVLKHGIYIMGPEVAELENQLSTFSGAKHCITCANGTDALQLALMAFNVGPGDAVFVPSFTFASTAEVVPLVGASLVMVDVDPRTFNMDVESLKRAIVHARQKGLTPKIVIAVDLFGLAADFDAINVIAKQEDMRVIDDAAQGFGAVNKGRRTGVLADITTTSFFPAKPLGCYGDGGALLTNSDEYASLLGSLRVHGKGSEKYDNVRVGVNSRLDTLQAAILLEKLAVYPSELEARQKLADQYTAALKNTFETPYIPDGYQSVWAQYTLKTPSNEARNVMMAKAKQAGIPTMVYYPKPLHEQTAYKDELRDPKGLAVSSNLAQTVFSLPMHGYLKNENARFVISTLS